MLGVRLGKFGFNVPSQVLYVGQTGLPVWVNRFESTALPRFVLFCFVSFLHLAFKFLSSSLAGMVLTSKHKLEE